LAISSPPEWRFSLAHGPFRLDNGFDQVLIRRVGLRWDRAMSDREQAPDSSGDEPHGEADLQDATEAALIRKVLRVQERHREGGVDPELDVDDEEPQLQGETDRNT
jgi:hypothetical protein